MAQNRALKTMLWFSHIAVCFIVTVASVFPLYSQSLETNLDDSAAYRDTLRMTMKYGDVNDAQEYSLEFQCFVIKILRRTDCKFSLDQIASIIQTHIVRNSIDVTYFLDDGVITDEASVVTSVWSKGRGLYRPNSNWDYRFNLDELNDHFETYKRIHKGLLHRYFELSLE